jgi:hypothetical protein
MHMHPRSNRIQYSSFLVDGVHCFRDLPPFQVVLIFFKLIFIHLLVMYIHGRSCSGFGDPDGRPPGCKVTPTGLLNLGPYTTI